MKIPTIWIRKIYRAITVSVVSMILLGAPVALAQGADGGELGEQTYNTVCLACHQMTGLGLPAVFPPLVEHAPELLAYEGNREYIAKLILYGLQGEVTILGQAYNQLMTPHEAILSNEQLAAVVNYVMHAWGNDALLPEAYEPFVPEDFEAFRGLGLTAQDVYALRQELGIGAE